MVMAHSAMAPRGGSTGMTGSAVSTAGASAMSAGASSGAWGSGETESVVFSRLTSLILLASRLGRSPLEVFVLDAEADAAAAGPFEAQVAGDFVQHFGSADFLLVGEGAQEQVVADRINEARGALGSQMNFGQQGFREYGLVRHSSFF